MSQPIDPQHEQTRATLRVIGPLVALTGLIFTLVGVGSFFSSFGSFEAPRYFWCAFIGLPMIAIGLGICKFAYMGAIARYMANEVAPVGKDAVNYMADGTKGAVRDIAAAVGEGLRSGQPPATGPGLRCPRCQADNDPSANFCKGCGSALRQTKRCLGCGEMNDADARFCDHCGKTVA